MKYTANDLDTMWRTVYGEARGAPDDCMEHVALAIRNRALVPTHPYGAYIASVCTQPRQFSCWNRLDPNFRVIQAATLRDPLAVTCREICVRVLEDQVEDVTQGSTHYCTLHLNPFWAAGKTPVFSDEVHKFYNNVR